MRLAAAAALALLSMVCGAELPPYVYEKMQREAPESLVLRVRSATVGADVVAEAQVEKVRRSAAGLKPGDVIRIRYAAPREGDRRPGPSSVPVVHKGRVYSAYLAKAESAFEPAAGGRSFSELRQEKK